MNSWKKKVKRYLPKSIINVYRVIRNKNFANLLLFKSFGVRFVPKLSDFPPMVFLEVTTRCNLKCVTCPREGLVRGGYFEIGDMDLEFYKECVEEIANYSDVVLRPFNDGEPLLHPNIIEMVQYAKKKNVYIWMNTNGLLLDGTKAKAFLDAGLDLLEVSIDAVSEESYELARLGGNYNKVVQNVKKYVELRNRRKNSCKIRTSYVQTKDNLSDTKKFKELWEGVVDEVLIRPFHWIDKCLADKRMCKDKTRRRYPCPQLWERLIINHDGKVKFCVQDCRNQGIIGDRKKQTIKEIWQSKQYEKIRKVHIHGEFCELSPCRDCNDYFQWFWF